MASGNFIIGEKGLSLKAFTNYIEPVFNENGLTITDKLGPIDRAAGIIAAGGVLTAVFGENLEEKVKSSLETARKKIDSPPVEKDPEIYNFQLPNDGMYTSIGIYSNDKTASEVFPLIAQDYLIKKMEPSIREVSEQIRSLLQKRVGDFRR